MNAESKTMIEQDQLHNENNETMQLQSKISLTKLCDVDSLIDVSSKTVENSLNHVEIVPICKQTSTDAPVDKISNTTIKQIAQNVKNHVRIDIDSKDEQNFNKKIDDSLKKDDRLFIDKNLIIQTTIGKDISDSPRLDKANELSDDYLTQMMKNLHDRDIALHDGVSFKSDRTECLKICSNEANKQNLIPIQEPLITDVSKKVNNNKELDKLESIVENNNSTAKLDVKEKPMTSDALTETVDGNESIDKSSTGKQNMLTCDTIVDKLHNSRDTTVIDTECGNNNTYELVTLMDNNNKKQSNLEEMPVDKLENVGSKGVFLQNKIKDDISTEKSKVIINKMQNLDWLKLGTRHSSIEKEEYNKSIKEELTEDAKTNSKNNKKRCSLIKTRKNRASGSFEQENTEDKNKISSSHVGLGNASKNEFSKSVYARGVEKSKDTKGVLLAGIQKTSIGRGRNERRKILLGSYQSRKQTEITDQSNKIGRTFPDSTSPTRKEKNISKNETHSTSLEYSLDKVEKLEDSTEDRVVTTDTTESRKEEFEDMEIDSKSHNDVELHNQLPLTSIAEHIDTSTQKNQDVINDEKKKLPSEKNHQESQSRLDTNTSSRPIYGRSVDENKFEKLSSSVAEYSQKTDEAIENNNQLFQNQNTSSKDILNKCQSFSKQENYPNKNISVSNTYNQYNARWGHNNYLYKQNGKSTEIPLYKGFTSNRHRNIDEDENRESEESFGKNQVFYDKSQGSKRYYDKCQDRNQNARLSNDIASNRNQGSHGDRYFDKSQNKGFGERFFDRNQDRSYSDRYSSKDRDSKSSSDRYSDKNQQSKISSERFHDRKHDENQIFMKKQESFNRTPVGFDKREDCSSKNQIGTKILDTLSRNQEFLDKNNKSLNSTIETCSKNRSTNEDTIDNYDVKNQCATVESHQTLNKEYTFRNQDTSYNSGLEHRSHYPCQRHQEKFDKLPNNFRLTPEHKDWNKDNQCESDVKFQKHYDNTQQAQRALNQVQQSHSKLLITTCQQEILSPVDQNIDMIKSQTSQSVDWNYKNTPKQEVLHSPELVNTSSYANVNMVMSTAASDDYNLQYNQTLLDSSNQFTHGFGDISAAGQRSNIVMAFDGNQNVQRALGIDPRIANQSQPPQGNNKDPSQSTRNIIPPSQPVYTNENVIQFFQTLMPVVANPHTNVACVHSQMNVNAPSFEVTEQSNEELSTQQTYAVQPTVLNHSQAEFVTLDNDCVLDAVLMNEISNISEDFLKLHQEISDLSKQLALRQAQLLALQIKLFKAARATEKGESQLENQQSSLPIQPANTNQLVQEQNQILPFNYVQTKHPNYPLGYGDASLNAQSTQMNIYKMLSNAANVQKHPTDKLSANSVTEPKITVQPVYFTQGNMYQPQTANYQMYADQTANNATYINMMAQRTEQRQTKSSVNQFLKQ